MIKRKGLLIIISAPSGVGKTTLCRKIVDSLQHTRHSVSYTTRAPRKGERDRIDYNFVAPEVFEEMIKKGEFLEWAVVHGNMYGTSRKDVSNMVKQGLDVVFDIDVQGAKQIKDNPLNLSFSSEHCDEGGGIFIFLLPPTLDTCQKRLKGRGLDSDEDTATRLSNAKKEIAEAFWYDYIVENDTIENTLENLKAIIIAEKSKTIRSGFMIERFLG